MKGFDLRPLLMHRVLVVYQTLPNLVVGIVPPVRTSRLAILDLLRFDTFNHWIKSRMQVVEVLVPYISRRSDFCCVVRVFGNDLAHVEGFLELHRSSLEVFQRLEAALRAHALLQRVVRLLRTIFTLLASAHNAIEERCVHGQSISGVLRILPQRRHFLAQVLSHDFCHVLGDRHHHFVPFRHSENTVPVVGAVAMLNNRPLGLGVRNDSLQIPITWKRPTRISRSMRRQKRLPPVAADADMIIRPAHSPVVRCAMARLLNLVRHTVFITDLLFYKFKRVCVFVF